MYLPTVKQVVKCIVFLRNRKAKCKLERVMTFTQSTRFVPHTLLYVLHPYGL